MWLIWHSAIATKDNTTKRKWTGNRKDDGSHKLAIMTMT
jgi:hypothetical protein